MGSLEYLIVDVLGQSKILEVLLGQLTGLAGNLVNNALGDLNDIVKHIFTIDSASYDHFGLDWAVLSAEAEAPAE